MQDPPKLQQECLRVPLVQPPLEEWIATFLSSKKKDTRLLLWQKAIDPKLSRKVARQMVVFIWDLLEDQQPSLQKKTSER